MQSTTETSAADRHHELLNHLSILWSYVAFLKDSELDADQTEMVDTMSDSVKKAHALAVELRADPSMSAAT